MAPINLDPHPAEGHSGDRTIGLAGAVSDAVRALNYATLAENAADGVPYPATAYDVVGRLHAAAAGMDQLVRQLAARVTEIGVTEDVAVSHGAFAGDPAGAVGNVLDALGRVQRSASMLEDALHYAQNALSPIGVRIPADDEDDPDNR